MAKMLALTWPIYWQTCHLIQPVEAYLLMVAKYLHNDSRGQAVRHQYTDKLMGELTASPDIFTLLKMANKVCL